MTDTVLCRRALQAFKAYYIGVDSSLAAEVGIYTSGYLARIGPYRLVLAVPWYNGYTGLTYTTLDTAFNVVFKSF